MGMSHPYAVAVDGIFHRAHEDTLQMMDATKTLETTLRGLEARMQRLAATVNVLTEKIDRAGGAAAPVAAPVAAPAPRAPPRLRFVFLEEAQRNPSNEFFDRLETAEKTEENKSELVFVKEKFFCLSWADGKQHITKIENLGNYLTCCRVSLTLRDDNRKKADEKKVGFMTKWQYKRLCIFVVSNSGSDECLAPGIG